MMTDEDKCTPRLKLQNALRKDEEASLMIVDKLKQAELEDMKPEKQVRTFSQHYVSGLFGKYTSK